MIWLHEPTDAELSTEERAILQQMGKEMFREGGPRQVNFLALWGPPPPWLGDMLDLPCWKSVEPPFTLTYGPSEEAGRE